MKINTVGHCTLCAKPIADIIRTFHGTGHPEVDDTPAAIGKFHPETRLVTLALTDGSKMDLSVCESCSDLSGVRLRTAWLRICYSQGKILDPTWARAKGVVRLNKDQDYWYRKSLGRFAANPPLGVLTIQRWGDIYDGSSVKQ